MNKAEDELEVRQEYYLNGQIYKEKTYLNGILHGMSKCWHINGALQYESPKFKGKPYGVFKAWYDDGSRFFEIKYANSNGDDRGYEIYFSDNCIRRIYTLCAKNRDHGVLIFFDL